jgi:hypothetical protein
MLHYRLRTLMILLALGPPALSGGWWARQKIIERHRQQQFDELIRLIQTTSKPDSWDDVGGPGALANFDGVMCRLIVEQAADDSELGETVEWND